MLRAEMECPDDEDPIGLPFSPDVLQLYDWPLEGFRYRSFVMSFDSGKPVQKEEVFLDR